MQRLNAPPATTTTRHDAAGRAVFGVDEVDDHNDVGLHRLGREAVPLPKHVLGTLDVSRVQRLFVSARLGPQARSRHAPK